MVNTRKPLEMSTIVIAVLVILILVQVVAAEKPNTPTLLIPYDGSEITTLTPTFTWSPFHDLDANDYQSAFNIRIAEAPGPNRWRTLVVLDKEYSGNASSVTPSEADYSTRLEDGKWYHWHIRVKDNNNDWSDWAADKENDASLYMDFRINMSLPPTPNLFAGGWQKINDLPRQINSIVSDPTNPKVLYAGTGSSGAGSGVYKSEDAGLRWKYTSNGLPSEDVESLAFNSDNPPILYAALDGGDIYASTDGAQNWTKLGNAGLMGFENFLFVAPSNKNVLFIIKSTRGIARSRNGGYAWMPVDYGLPKSTDRDAYTQSLAIDPTDENIVYLGTGWGSFNGNGVYKSVDGGEKWTPANQNMTDYGITALAVNPKKPQVIYAGTVSGELFKSTNSGQSWNDITKKVPFKNEIKGIAIDSSETIYLLSERVGIMFSNNGGINWDMIGKPTESDYPSYTAFSAIFDPKPIIVVGISDEGGWRYTELPEKATTLTLLPPITPSTQTLIPTSTPSTAMEKPDNTPVINSEIIAAIINWSGVIIAAIIGPLIAIWAKRKLEKKDEKIENENLKEIK